MLGWTAGPRNTEPVDRRPAARQASGPPPAARRASGPQAPPDPSCKLAKNKLTPSPTHKPPSHKTPRHATCPQLRRAPRWGVAPAQKRLPPKRGCGVLPAEAATTTPSAITKFFLKKMCKKHSHSCRIQRKNHSRSYAIFTRTTVTGARGRGAENGEEEAPRPLAPVTVVRVKIA